MKKLTFGTPESHVPSRYCPTLNYRESDVSYPTDRIRFKTSARGCRLEFPMKPGENIFGLGLQLQILNLTGRQMVTRVNSDPIAPTGDSHAPVPFFLSTAGYGIFIDTARYAEFDFGRPHPVKPQKLEAAGAVGASTDEIYAQRATTKEAVITVHVPVAQGVDVYVIEGKTLTDIVAQYNLLAGGG